MAGDERRLGPAARGFRRLATVFADGGYESGPLADYARRWGGWAFEVVKRLSGTAGFVVLPKRWAIERTFAWVGRNRMAAREEIVLERQEQSSPAPTVVDGVMLVADGDRGQPSAAGAARSVADGQARVLFVDLTRERFAQQLTWAQEVAKLLALELPGVMPRVVVGVAGLARPDGHVPDDLVDRVRRADLVVSRLDFDAYIRRRQDSPVAAAASARRYTAVARTAGLDAAAEPEIYRPATPMSDRDLTDLLRAGSSGSYSG